MDLGDYKPMTKARNSYSNLTQLDRTEHRISTHRTSIKQEHNQISPAPSAITDISPRTCSNHFEEYSSFGTAQSSPQCYSAMSKPDPARLPFSYPRSEYAESLYNEYPFYPNYMANTESSRAKVRSHSAPKQRPVETFERQPSRRRPSLEGRNVPRAVRMQRSSSHVGSTAQNYQYPWSVKLDRSAVSLKDSECGSTSTVLTNTNYCRSLVGFEVSNVVWFSVWSNMYELNSNKLWYWISTHCNCLLFLSLLRYRCKGLGTNFLGWRTNKSRGRKQSKLLQQVSYF